jgi:hypothetical protein
VRKQKEEAATPLVIHCFLLVTCGIETDRHFCEIDAAPQPFCGLPFHCAGSTVRER